jgi:hypothetical protein
MMKPRDRRDYNLRTRYGISIERYDEMFAVQDGRCAICRRLPGAKRLHVDHEHRTGRVRGLLCVKCNFALFHDDKPHLKAARHKYLFYPEVGQITEFLC